MTNVSELQNVINKLMNGCFVIAISPQRSSNNDYKNIELCVF